jgi:non-homologous end joining protein Ku
VTAIALYTRLGRMLEEKMIKEDDEAFWTGIVSGHEIKLPVTGLEAGSQEIPFHEVDARTGNLVFGKVVP